MSKSYPGKEDNGRRARRSKLGAFVSISLVLSLVVTAVALSSWGGSGTTQVNKERKSGEMTIASFAPSSPSKEYVYAGGRLVATEEPQNCSYSLVPTSQSFAAIPAGGGGSFNVSATDGCSWTAVSNDSWITTSSAGTGSGTVTYTVGSNTLTTKRTGTITVSAQTFTVLQGAAFLDVPTNHPFYNEIGKLSARGITSGCGGGSYCPDSTVTREQMAAFLIRGLGQFNPPPPASQRYSDVPPSNTFYAFIEEMAVRQITLGCGGGNYCPADPVFREQMAAFIVRALGEFNPPMPQSQRFNDVPPSNVFYAFIDRLAALGITTGCSQTPPLYCPTDPVTRGAMAKFLVAAFNL